MELQQTRPNTKAKLDPPPSNNFSWLSVLRRKSPRNSHPGDDHDTGLRLRFLAEQSGPQQPQHRQSAAKATTHVKESVPPETDPTIGGQDRDNATQEIDHNHSNERTSGAGKEPSAKPSAVTDKDKMKLPESESAQPGLDLTPQIPRWQPEKASQLQNGHDGKSSYQPEIIDEVNPHQEQDTIGKPPHETEDAFKYEDQHQTDLDAGYAVATTGRAVITTGSEAEQQKDRVKDLVWQILKNKLRGAESVSGSIAVEIEPHGTKQVLIIKCYGLAVTRAREIRKLLEKADYRRAYTGFTLVVREESQPGTDLSLLWGPSRSDDIDSSSNVLSINGNVQGNVYYSSEKRNAGKEQTDRYANTPYWNSASILVDCLLPPRRHHATNTLCGALVRMMSCEYQGESQLRTWTCGGLIHVNGVPYALTTAHPLILDNRRKEEDIVGPMRPSVVNDVFPAEHELLSWGESNGTYEAQSWQTLGQVYKHALSSVDHVPANYDWLLIDIAKDYLLPNLRPNQDGNQGPHSKNSGSLSICTWRGLLQATLLPGSSFMIIGESSFKAMKLSVDRPMVLGDSGSWVFKGQDVFGVVIAGSTEASGENFAYAISMMEVCRNISIGMGGASVHVPTPIENAINARQLSWPGKDTAHLAALLIGQLIEKVAREGGTINDLPPVQQSNSDVDSLIALARFCPLLRDPPFRTGFSTAIYRFRLDPLHFLVRINSPGSRELWPQLCKYHELQNLTGFFRILITWMPTLDATAEAIQHIMIELGISPIPSARRLMLFLRDMSREFCMKWQRSAPITRFDPLLSRVVARLLYAASVRRFFVYCGPLAASLYALFGGVAMGVVLIDAKFDGASLRSQAQAHFRGSDHWASQVRAFIVTEDRFVRYLESTRIGFNFYGDIVAHSELQGLLHRLATRQSS